MRQERSIMKASRPASWKFQIITPLRCISGANIFCIILGFKVQFNGKYTPLSGYWMHYTSNYVDGKREINWANSQWCPYPHTERTTAQSSLSPGRVQCENYSWNYFYDRPLCRGRASWIWRAGSSRLLELQKRFIRRFVITEKAPTRAFSWLKGPTSAFTFKTLLQIML